MRKEGEISSGCRKHRYCLDRMRLGRFTLAELRRGKPSLVAIWRQTDDVEDINKVLLPSYFSSWGSVFFIMRSYSGRLGIQLY